MHLRNSLLFVLLLSACSAQAQSDMHYTMFMYNKLLYNPAYAGSRETMSVNGVYRNQWTGIKGAPKTFSIAADGPLGSYMKPERKVALGLSLSSEELGVEKNTELMTYYAYRLRIQGATLSMGLRGGLRMYTANYSQLNPYQQNDQNLTRDIRNALLPNAGAGVYLSGTRYYVGLSVPNMLQNFYDAEATRTREMSARQIRSYYFSGGYVFEVNEQWKLEPQVMVRYAHNSRYGLPLSSDINLTAIYADRIMAGITYRTDQSFEAIIHLQATKSINIGYSYDYLLSALSGYSGGTHELVVGYDLIRDHAKHTNPRFLRAF